MNDTPAPATQQLDWRLCRAVALVVVGAAMHLPLPGHALGPVPTIAPVNFVHDEPRRAQPRLIVERTTVFAPARPARDEGGSVAPAPRSVPAAIGLMGGARSASLLDARPAEIDSPSSGTSGVPVPTSGAVRRSELSSTADAARPSRLTADHGTAKLPDSSDPAVPHTTYASVSPAVLRTTAGSESAASSEPVAAGPAAATEEQVVRRLLDAYAGAYERLDVEAAQAIYPNVDEKALRRAFDRLAAQRVTLQKCGITISGSTANARCRGSATFQPRIGSRSVRIASREWTFDLSKKDTAWQIVNTFVH